MVAAACVKAHWLSNLSKCALVKEYGHWHQRPYVSKVFFFSVVLLVLPLVNVKNQGRITQYVCWSLRVVVPSRFLIKMKLTSDAFKSNQILTHPPWSCLQHTLIPSVCNTYWNYMLQPLCFKENNFLAFQMRHFKNSGGKERSAAEQSEWPCRKLCLGKWPLPVFLLHQADLGASVKNDSETPPADIKVPQSSTRWIILHT